MTERHEGDGKLEPHEGNGKLEPHEGDGKLKPHEGNGKSEPHEGNGKPEPHEGNGKPEPHEIERYKSVFEYFRHLVTLSTGSLVILATFLDKIVKTREWKILVILSLIGFLVTIIGSIVSYSLLIFDFPGGKRKANEWEDKLGGMGLLFAWFGFIFGIISLSVFTIKNII